MTDPRHHLSGQQPEDQDPGQQHSDEQGGQRDRQEGERVVVLTEGGMGVAHAPSEEDREQQRQPTDMVEEPAKVMRLGSMIKQLLEEVRNAPLDEAGRQRLAEIHRRSLTELERGLSEELVEELERITLPFAEDTPSEAELRIAQAQLVGWLEGLFHGIQTAIVAQQMAAQAQLQQMRRALPVGHPQGQQGPGMPQMPQRREDRGTGQYL